MKEYWYEFGYELGNTNLYITNVLDEDLLDIYIKENYIRIFLKNEFEDDEEIIEFLKEYNFEKHGEGFYIDIKIPTIEEQHIFIKLFMEEFEKYFGVKLKEYK